MESKNQGERELKTKQNKYWLQTQVNDILEPMMLATCQENPGDKVGYSSYFIFFLDQIHARVLGEALRRKGHEG
jgi:hypothetical protein